MFKLQPKTKEQLKQEQKDYNKSMMWFTLVFTTFSVLRLIASVQPARYDNTYDF